MKLGNWVGVAGIAVLWFGVLAAAMANVYVKHESRKLFVELQQLQERRDHLEIDWGRFRIEQSTWATHGRVEKLAHDQLQMLVPETEDILVVMP